MSDDMPCTLSRRRALWVIGSAPFFSSCARTAPIRVASKHFVESVIIAEAYAASLESASFVVQRKMFLGIAQELADGTNRPARYPLKDGHNARPRALFIRLREPEVHTGEG
jgi:hypothetical protein